MIPIIYAHGGARIPPQPHPFDIYKDYLVELRPIEYPDISEVVIVYARNFPEAVFEAFATRNIPSDWLVYEVSE